MKIKFSKFNLAVILLFISSLVIRLPYLGVFPPALLQDEASIGFNALSIAQTGKDEWGVSYPLIFKAFGDDKLPVYIYLTALTYKIMGWTPFLPRIPSAIAGSITSVLVCLLTYKILKSKSVALFIGSVIAFSPWTIHLSRMALESNLALCFFTAGLLCFEYAKESNKSKIVPIIFTAVFLAFSTYTYVAYRLIVIMLLIFIVILKIISQGRKYFQIDNIYLKIPIITILMIMPGLILGASLARYSQTMNITPGLVNSVVFQKQNTCHLLGYATAQPLLSKLCRLTFNTTITPIKIFVNNFTEYISPNFLFFHGDTILNRNPTASGAFNIILLPLFYTGVVIGLSKLKKYYFFVCGFLIVLIPSALTGAPHAIRLSGLIPFVAIFIALGSQYWFSRSKLLFPIIEGALIISCTFFWLNYMISTYGNSQDFLSYGRDIAVIAYKEFRNGKTVYIDRNILPDKQSFIGFWNNVDARDYQKLEKRIETDSMGFIRPSQLGNKILFDLPNIGDFISSKTQIQNTIFITKDSLPYIPTRKITNLTGEYVFGYVYDLEAIRKQELDEVLVKKN